MNSYKVIRGNQIRGDLAEIEEFLFETYRSFGETVDEANDRSEQRVLDIYDFFGSLGERPHRGTLCTDLLHGMRRTTKDKFVIYFDVDEDTMTVCILGVFFGGQDHASSMMVRTMQ